MKIPQSIVFAYGVMAVLLLLLILSVNLIGLGAQAWSAGEARSLLHFVGNPFLGLVIGLFATALVQSSGLVITLVVGIVASGFPVALAIPVVMGANVGTTVTNTLVSLFQKNEADSFERSFAAATVHDFFNLLAVILLFPLEQWLHPLERLSQELVPIALTLLQIPAGQGLNPLQYTIVPVSHQVQQWTAGLPTPWNHAALIVLGIGILMVSLPLLSQQFQRFPTQPWKDPIAQGGWRSLLMGLGLTVLVHSSSATTSLMVPLAGSGVLSLSQIYPFTLGANIGTCLTGLLATAALPPALLPMGLQIAIVHLLYNCSGVALIYGIPLLRSFPMEAASRLASLAKSQKPLAIGYVGVVFFGLPLLVLWIAQAVSSPLL